MPASLSGDFYTDYTCCKPSLSVNGPKSPPVGVSLQIEAIHPENEKSHRIPIPLA